MLISMKKKTKMLTDKAILEKLQPYLKDFELFEEKPKIKQKTRAEFLKLLDDKKYICIKKERKTEYYIKPYSYLKNVRLPSARSPLVDNYSLVILVGSIVTEGLISVTGHYKGLYEGGSLDTITNTYKYISENR